MTQAGDAVTVIDNAAQDRFEVTVEGHRAELVYRRVGDQLVLVHTEARGPTTALPLRACPELLRAGIDPALNWRRRCGSFRLGLVTLRLTEGHSATLGPGWTFTPMIYAEPGVRATGHRGLHLASTEITTDLFPRNDDGRLSHTRWWGFERDSRCVQPVIAGCWGSVSRGWLSSAIDVSER